MLAYLLRCNQLPGFLPSVFSVCDTFAWAGLRSHYCTIAWAGREALVFPRCLGKPLQLLLILVRPFPCAEGGAGCWERGKQMFWSFEFKAADLNKEGKGKRKKGLNGDIWANLKYAANQKVSHFIPSAGRPVTSQAWGPVVFLQSLCSPLPLSPSCSSVPGLPRLHPCFWPAKDFRKPSSLTSSNRKCCSSCTPALFTHGSSLLALLLAFGGLGRGGFTSSAPRSLLQDTRSCSGPRQRGMEELHHVSPGFLLPSSTSKTASAAPTLAPHSTGSVKSSSVLRTDLFWQMG